MADDNPNKRRTGIRLVAWVGFSVALLFYLGFILRAVLSA